VEVPPRTTGEPSSDLGMLVGGVIVDDEVDVEFCRHIGFDVSQEGEELLVAMAGLALSEDRAVEHIERCEEGCGAVPFVIVRDPFDVTEAHGEHRLGTFERLNLALFIDTEDEGFVGRIEVEADHVAQLLDEEGIGGELEAAGPMWLQSEELEESVDRALGQVRLGGHRAHAPVRARLGLAGQRLGQEFCDGLVLDAARSAAAQLIVQTLQAMADEAVAPFADRVRSDAEIGRYRFVAGLLLTRQDDVCPLGQRRRQASRPRHRQKRGTFLIADRQRALRSPTSHRVSPFRKIPESDPIFMSTIFGTEH